MYTIEEVRLSRPHQTFHIAKGATQEFEREDIIRQLENGRQAKQHHNTSKLRLAMEAVAQGLIGWVIARRKSGERLSAELPQPV